MPFTKKKIPFNAGFSMPQVSALGSLLIVLIIFQFYKTASYGQSGNHHDEPVCTQT